MTALGRWLTLFRLLQVHLQCGSEEHVVSVQEPSRCEYHMDFLTPLACRCPTLTYPYPPTPL